MAEYLQAQGDRLRAARKALNLSQEDAAHLIGVSFKTYNSWENGKSEPRDSNWRKIEEQLKVSAEEMRGEPPSLQIDRIETYLLAIMAHLGIEPDPAPSVLGDPPEGPIRRGGDTPPSGPGRSPRRTPGTAPRGTRS